MENYDIAKVAQVDTFDRSGKIEAITNVISNEKMLKNCSGRFVGKCSTSSIATGPGYCTLVILHRHHGRFL